MNKEQYVSDITCTCFRVLNITKQIKFRVNDSFLDMSECIWTFSSYEWQIFCHFEIFSKNVKICNKFELTRICLSRGITQYLQKKANCKYTLPLVISGLVQLFASCMTWQDSHDSKLLYLHPILFTCPLGQIILVPVTVTL